MWFLLASLAAVFWGISYGLSEWLFHRISILTLLTFEFSAAAIVFGVLSLFKGTWTHDLKVLSEPKPLIFLIVCILVLALAELCISFSIREKNATVSSIIELSYPLFVILTSLVVFKTSNLTLSVALGGLLIFSGAGVIAVFAR